jgi:hypothetical protein
MQSEDSVVGKDEGNENGEYKKGGMGRSMGVTGRSHW